jgi:hypothetical protein
MAEKLPWSISTTVRNPERLRGFLKVLKKIEGEIWNKDTQCKYQTLLIQERVYGFGNSQFYNASRRCSALTREQIRLIESMEPITYDQAKEIFKTKNYVDPAHRGRESINPLKKLGLIVIESGKIKVTPLGNYLLQEDYDLGEMFFRSFIKWQLPNPSNVDYKESDGYDIKPFIGTLHLIDRVNHKWAKLNRDPVGISKDEFSLFAQTLINYKDIDKQAQEVVNLRLECNGKSQQEQKKLKEKYGIKFAREFLGTNEPKKIKKLLKNLKHYGDNTIRYFRLTRYLFIRGNGFYVDLEPRRQIEITNLLRFDNAKSLAFPDKTAYLNYIADIRQPELPWETETELTKIAEVNEKEIKELIKKLIDKKIQIPPFSQKDIKQLSTEELKRYIEDLRIYRREINSVQLRFESQEIDNLVGYINALKRIYRSERKPVELERLVTLALNALNDALNIKPNFLVGDDNEPTFTAPPNKPDIECFYDGFNSVCEVTMLTDRSQWYHEGQPVMRHVRDFENNNTDKIVFCLFVAPRLHRDTVNTFWNAIKYEYEGSKQRIIPLTIGQLIELLEILLQIKTSGRQFKHTDLLELYSKIIMMTNNIKRSDLWLEKIPETINEWKKHNLSKRYDGN